jgi:hypothetical protein
MMFDRLVCSTNTFPTDGTVLSGMLPASFPLMQVCGNINGMHDYKRAYAATTTLALAVLYQHLRCASWLNG